MLSEMQLMLRARDLVLAMMSNASSDVISPLDWWTRAKSALVTAAARGRSWGQIVSIMAKKLQIETLRNDTSNLICSMALDGELLRQWQRIVGQQAIYIVAEAQAERQRQKEESKS
jgi:hypothetical protein